MNLPWKTIANEIAALPPELQSVCQKTVIEIEQISSQSLDIEQFCEDTVACIHRAFSLYSANLYAVDSKHEWVILIAGTSTVAQEAKQKSHKLPIDGNSLISMVVQTSQGQIMQEKQTQIDYCPSATYPPIHSELAMPIVLPQHQSTIGVLDIQSDKYEAFGKDEFMAFSIIASYIAFVFDDALPRTHSQ